MTHLSRRQLLRGLQSLFAVGLAGCAQPKWDDTALDTGDFLEDVEVDMAAVAANIEALMDVILPAEYGANGSLVSPGAVEAGAYSVLQLDRLVPLARAQGLLPPLPDWIDENASVLDPATQGLISAELDRMASEYTLFTPFRELSRDQQERAVADAFVDPDRAPVMEFIRAICFLAYLGAVTSDVGLQAIGYPRFEDFADGLAVSGYPRTVDGVVDDYTYNLAPEATVGDDLSGVLNADGDLI